MVGDEKFYKYWGKARKRDDGAWDYHLLPYHCLDVAAVARVWLEQDYALLSRIAYAIGIEGNDERLYGIISFFLAVHDFGKFDIRFQSKVPEIRDIVWAGLGQNDLQMSQSHIAEFNHGEAGYGAFIKFFPELLALNDRDENLLDQWKPWCAAVAGHHGVISKSADWRGPNVECNVAEHDRQARKEWFRAMREMFLSCNNNIPNLPAENQAFIAGFCSVVDWIASNDLFVRWIQNDLQLGSYFEEALAYCRKTNILRRTGITGCNASIFAGVAALLAENNKPRQIQTLIDETRLENGLTIIESATGSGKTEAALALAWKLVADGQADSIVFALPTQATADAMLERLQTLAPVLFEGGDANLVLAHGKAKYNAIFANLRAAGRSSAENCDQGSIQCAEWISTSRKRVFLGQIGVCTIDQVLLSVLPIRHNFVRSFGVMKSVLIVDEVHAYDRYMCGLLEEVLKRQKAVGGSAILLSATLPSIQKQELFESWQRGCGESISTNAPYPLISRLSINGDVSIRTVTNNERPPMRDVQIETVVSRDMEPDANLMARVVRAANGGATVAIVCNLVQSAQKIARELREIASIPVDIFHARYRFKDRQSREAVAKKLYGKEASRATGRILVATQVVEQSLDLDFDWLVTQLCPVDLLFQRMGRLHRHERNRPVGFEKPICTILSTDCDEFGAHEKIYGDARVLWRTRELLGSSSNTVCFPAVYRTWIEAVYGRNEWEGGPEPDSVIGKSYAFREMQKQLWYEAKQRATTGMNPFADTDQNASSLTRGKEMGLTVVLVQAKASNKTLLDGECLVDLKEFEREEWLNMNAISVPVGWKKMGLPSFEDSCIFLPMAFENDGWVWRNGNYSLKYTTDYGLERLEGDE